MKEFIKQLSQDVDVDTSSITNIRNSIVATGILSTEQKIEKKEEVGGEASDKHRRKWEGGDGSISLLDCIFLHILVKKLKPLKIFEIGTWFGVSSSILCEAAGEHSEIRTCDENNLYTYPDKYKNNVTFNNVHSSIAIKQLKESHEQVDFIFVDGRITEEEAKDLVGIMGDNLIVATHDYKPPFDIHPSDTFLSSRPYSQGIRNIVNLQKGVQNIILLQDVIQFPSKLVCPDDNIHRVGYDIGREYKINSSVGLIMSEKIYNNLIYEQKKAK